MLGEAYDGLKSALALIDLRSGLSTDGGLDHVMDVRGVQAMSSNRLTIDCDRQVLLADHAIHFDIARALDVFELPSRPR